jgi:peptide-methionine (R)-S-oxide reductase
MLFLLVSCNGISQEQQQKPKKEYTVVKTDAEWKAELPQMAYYVLRKAGTERAFSGPLNYNKEKGTYVCAGCQTPLYESKYKFESGFGLALF